MTGGYVELGPNLRGYEARPSGDGSYPAVLVYMEAFGLNSYVESECARLAALGFVAIAPDFYHGAVFSYDDFESAARTIAEIGDAGFLADVAAAIAYLDAAPFARHDAYGIVGFCMGGRLAFLTAAEYGPKIAACASFYGGGIAPQTPRLGRATLTSRAPEISANVLLIYGADDGSIAPDEIARVTEALSAAKKSFAVRVFAGAGHGFASTDRESYVPAVTEDAWAETVELFERTLATRS